MLIPLQKRNGTSCTRLFIPQQKWQLLLRSALQLCEVPTASKGRAFTTQLNNTAVWVFFCVSVWVHLYTCMHFYDLLPNTCTSYTCLCVYVCEWRLCCADHAVHSSSEQSLFWRTLFEAFANIDWNHRIFSWDLIVLTAVCDMIIGILKKHLNFWNWVSILTPRFHCHISLTLHVAHNFVPSSKWAHIPLGALLKLSIMAAWWCWAVHIMFICRYFLIFSLPKIDLMLDTVLTSCLTRPALCSLLQLLSASIEVDLQNGQSLLRHFSSLVELWALSRTTTICSSRCVLAVLWHKLTW